MPENRQRQTGAGKQAEYSSLIRRPASEPSKELSSRAAFSTRHLLLFSLCSLLFFCSQFYRATNAIIAPQLQANLSLTPESLGILSASFFYAFAFTQIPLALLLDRLGARLIMTVLTLAGSLGACLFAVSEGLYAALAGRILLGFGMAGNLMGSMKLFSQWFSPTEFATVSGLLIALGTLGNIGASTPLALLVNAIGWRWSFIVIGLATAGIALFFYCVIRDRPHTPAKTAGSPRTIGMQAGLRALLLNRDYWLISCGTFFRYGTVMAIQALWAGPYLMQGFGLSPVDAGNIIILTTAGYIVGSWASGWFSDRIMSSPKYVAIMALAGMAITDISFVFSWGRYSTAILAVSFFSLGLFSGAGNVMYAHIKSLMPSEITGMAITGINFFTMLGVGFYIHFMGWVLEYFPAEIGARPERYQGAFALCLAGVVAATALYFFTRETGDWEKAGR